MGNKIFTEATVRNKILTEAIDGNKNLTEALDIHNLGKHEEATKPCDVSPKDDGPEDKTPYYKKIQAQTLW